MFSFLPFFFLDNKKNISRKIADLLKQKTAILYILFFVVQLIGVGYSNDIGFAINRVEIMLPMLFLPAVISAEKITKQQFQKIINISKYTIVASFLYYLFIHIAIDKRDLNTFVHFTIEKKLGVSQFYLIFILFIPIISSINGIIKKEKILIHLVLLFAAIGICFLLGSKTILIFMFLFWIFLIIQTYKKSKKRVFIPIVIGVLLFSVTSQLPVVKHKIEVFSKTSDLDLKTIITKNSYTITKNTFEHRVLINYLSVKEIISSLPFGVGTGDYQQALNKQYRKINFKAALATNLNNHNQYLWEFLKTGLLGGILFLVLIVNLLKKINQKQKYYPYFIIFFSVACMLESYLVRQHGVVIFAFLIPFFLYNDEKEYL